MNRLFRGALFNDETVHSVFDLATKHYRATWQNDEWRAWAISTWGEGMAEPPATSPIRTSYIDVDGVSTTGDVDDFLVACADPEIDEVTAQFNITGVDIYSFRVTFSRDAGTRVEIGASQEATVREIGKPFVDAFNAGAFRQIRTRDAEPSSVFISHAHVDAPVATALQACIEAAFGSRVTAFCSSDENRSIQLGDPLTQRIVEAIRTSKAALVLVSPNSVGRPWINIETGAAWANEKLVVPCCILGFEAGALPSPLSQLKAATLGGSKKELVQLLTRLAEVAGESIVWSDAEARRVVGRLRTACRTGVEPQPKVAEATSAASDLLQRVLKEPERYEGEFIHNLAVTYEGYDRVDFSRSAPPQFWGARFAANGRAAVYLKADGVPLDVYCTSGRMLDTLDRLSPGAALVTTLQAWTAQGGGAVFQLAQ